MKKKELKDLQTKSIAELKELSKKTQDELVKLKMDAQAGKLKNIRLVAQRRRDLAQIKTVLREKEINQ